MGKRNLLQSPLKRRTTPLEVENLPDRILERTDSCAVLCPRLARAHSVTRERPRGGRLDQDFCSPRVGEDGRLRAEAGGLVISIDARRGQAHIILAASFHMDHALHILSLGTICFGFGHI